jgi:tetratricopeptide (TPR) repeat protein
MKHLIIIVLKLVSISINAEQIADTSLSSKLLSLELQFWKSTDDSTKMVILNDKISLYKSLNMYEQALKETARSEKYAPNQKSIAIINYNEMLFYFLMGKYDYARDIEITSVELAQINKQKEYALMKLESLNETEKWEQCKLELSKLSSISDSSQQFLIQKLPITYPYKNPEQCKRLSTFLPGLGEIKAGYPMKGVTSFVINAGLIAFTGYNFYGGFYLTGAVSGVLPFLKFYSGGKRLSERLAERHNLEEINKLKKQYTNIIQQSIPD